MTLTISPDKVCFVVAKAREIDVKAAPEKRSDDSDDMERILEDSADDAIGQQNAEPCLRNVSVTRRCWVVAEANDPAL